ncbi:kinesin-like protein KIF16B isoform X2 [Xenopus laevis]|uniref:Kinesin-like protein KIF16B isoform X2 n=1 Tax=Xenopus laevis TaxID=8355 RepID=A0A8J0V9W0_XENLA|nr:kinesin-like protein KIF16B isoform X2 [Xenopus laevis]
MASVKVAVRVRPMNRREKDLEAKFIIEMEGKKTTITNIKIPDVLSGDLGRERTKTFTYDFSYFSVDSKNIDFASQERVFKDLGTDVLQSAFEGYNACIFAYGQTGSGKSYTMMGNPGDSGLIPRICEGLFSRIAETTRWGDASFRTEVSYLEIYNERVRDLLRRKSSKTFNLRVREHPKEGPYVEDLSKHLVQNYGDVEELMDAGNINRTTAATGMNDVSSRSHAIFTINFTQAKFDAEMPCETVSKIHLVDLAGSERADATGATGVRLKEGGNINKSLVTLGNVISALADLSQDAANHLAKKKQVFVPYRDSVLTWLLKDSLGGNSKTIMIATISPADINYGETLSTLRYANRAKNIINKPTINEDTNVKLIRELRAEIARLKALLAQGNQIALLDSPTALSMEEKLQQNEARVEELTKEWTNKWNETQNILKEQTLALRKEGIGVVLDSELPHLIGIDDDLLSTGIILYHLKEGRTYVGREDAAADQDIVLHGLDLESEHCIFENLIGTVTLIPLNGSQCSVNGVQILESTQLNQGAVILLGRTNMFRFNHPKEAAKLREKRKSGLLSSFSLSMTDLSKSCENLSAVMLYNPGLEFERQQREELEKLESKRKLIKEMEVKQKYEKAELEKMQQEVESQRKETEIVQLQIRKQEESLKRRSLDIESRLKDLLAEKVKFEEERLREQEIELQKKKQEEECFIKVQEELQRLQELHNTEKAEKMEIFRELEKLKKEKDDQYLKLEAEKKRLEEQEREQLKLVVRLEEQLREKQEMIQLFERGDVSRLEEEIVVLEDVREDLLRAKEARSEGEGDPEEVEKATNKYTEYKRMQLEQLSVLEGDLHRQTDCLEKEIKADHDTLSRLCISNVENGELHKTEEESSIVTPQIAEELEMIQQTENRIHCKERQLNYLKQTHLPAVLDEKQRASEILNSGLLGLDKTLYQIEKEIEEKADQLHQFRASSDQLQQLQETFEFTTNIARQEEKVRRKEKEILESREKQQREALEQAVAKLERRHSALQRHSTIDVEIEEQKCKLAALKNSEEQADLQATLEAEQKALEQDRERLAHEIQQLKQKIHVADPLSKNLSGSVEEKPSLVNSPASPVKSQSHLLTLNDDRIHAYIEEEVQRRLLNINMSCDNLNGLSLSSSADFGMNSDAYLNGATQRKLKYENVQHPEKFRNLRMPGTKTTSALPDLTRTEYQHLAPVTDALADFSETYLDSQEKYLSKGNEKRTYGSSISEYFEVLADTKCELSQLVSKNISKNKCLHESVPCASCHQTQLELSENPLCHQDFIKTEYDLTSMQQIPSSVIADTNEICHCSLSETGMLCETNLKENISLCQSPTNILPEFSGSKVNSEEADKFIPDNTVFNVFSNKLSYLYKNTHLPTIKEVVDQAKKLYNKQDNRIKFNQVLSLVKDIQVSKYFHLPMTNHGDPCAATESPPVKHVKLYTFVPSHMVSVEPGQPMICELSPRKEIVAFHDQNWQEVCRNTKVFRHPFVQLMNELQSSLPEELLEYLSHTLPELQIEEKAFKSAYWLCVANCSQSEPQPACILLFSSHIHVIDFSNTIPSLFVTFPLFTLQEIRICFGGQSFLFLGRNQEPLLTGYTFSGAYTQQVCGDIIESITSESDYDMCRTHPLLTKDLMRLSLDWNVELSDIVCSNGFKLTSNFRAALADLVYLLHENTEGTKPSLGDMSLLFYSIVRVDHGHRYTYRSLVLTDTSIALVTENPGFHERACWVNVRLCTLPDLKCIILADKGDLTKITVVFSKNTNQGVNVSTRHNELLPTFSNVAIQKLLPLGTDLWSIHLSSTKKALLLIRHITE